MARALDAGGGSMMDRFRLPLTVLVLSFVAIGLGWVSGSFMVKSLTERAVEVYKAQREETKPLASKYVGEIELRKVPAVVTNLANSATDWVRIEASIVFERGAKKDPDLLVAETRQDMLSYLRTVSLAQIQGASGLVHLREDVNERAKIRSGSLIKEVIIETLVVQ